MILKLALVAVTALPAAAVAQTAPAPVATPAATPLSQIPGVTVKYYDVTGTTIEEFRASMNAQRPINPATGQATPSSASWSISSNLKKSTTGDVCKIVGVTAQFQGEVTLPRLVEAEGSPVPAPVKTEWQRFVTSLEGQQSRFLSQVRARTSEVERAVMASSCEGAGAAADAAIANITATIRPAAPAPATPPPTAPVD